MNAHKFQKSHGGVNKLKGADKVKYDNMIKERDRLAKIEKAGHAELKKHRADKAAERAAKAPKPSTPKAAPKAAPPKITPKPAIKVVTPKPAVKAAPKAAPPKITPKPAIKVAAPKPSTPAKAQKGGRRTRKNRK
jgi:hypothetical protein